MKPTRSRRWLALPAAAVAAVAVAPTALASTAPPATGGGDAGDLDLSGICPETVVIQTDWNPEAEHGWLYQMVGDDAVIDAEGIRVSGTLFASGGVDTGVEGFALVDRDGRTSAEGVFAAGNVVDPRAPVIAAAGAAATAAMGINADLVQADVLSAS